MEKLTSVNKLWMHYFTIFSCAGAAGLDYIIADSPSYSRKSEIIEFECLILSQNLLEYRLKSQNIVKTDQDKILLKNILSKLFEKYTIECTDDESVLRIENFIQVIPKRMDDYEELYFNYGPIKLAQGFFNVLFNELDTLEPYIDNLAKLKNIKVEINEINILTKLIRNIFYVVDLFFKNGINDYIEKELNSTKDFDNLSNEYLNKYFE